MITNTYNGIPCSAFLLIWLTKSLANVIGNSHDAEGAEKVYGYRRHLWGYEGYLYPSLFGLGVPYTPLFEQCQSIFYHFAFTEIAVSALLRECKKLVPPLFVYVRNWYPHFLDQNWYPHFFGQSYALVYGAERKRLGRGSYAMRVTVRR